MFDSLRGLDPTVFFTPGRKGYLLFAKNAKGGGNAWSQRVPVRIRAMVLTPDHLYVAGPPDVVDPKDPLAAFEGRKGALLRVFWAKDGSPVKSYPLSSPVAFDGLIAARGRLYLTTQDGHLICMGKN